MSNNLIINNKALEQLFFNLIKENKWELFFQLIQSNVFDVNYRDYKGRNALFWAIHKKNSLIIEKLIELNIEKNVTISLSAINYAIYQDNVKVLKTLKKCAYDLDEKDEVNSTPLIYAVLYNKLNSINYLVNNGADIQHEDFFGNSALSLANDLKIQYLIEKFKSLL